MSESSEKLYSHKSIGKDNAIALAKSKWWEDKTPVEIAKVQLFTTELCMPFPLFHESIEKALGRPVFTHEFALHWKELCQELMGEKEPPTMQEIIELIPEEKRIVIQI